MSEIQFQSHKEQMEALRSEFCKAWEDEAYKLELAGLSAKAIFWAMQAAWNIWKKGRAGL